METCHDHEIAYWPDMGCSMCAAQAEIARLQAEVDRLTALIGKQDAARERNGWNDAIEAAADLILHPESMNDLGPYGSSTRLFAMLRRDVISLKRPT